MAARKRKVNKRKRTTSKRKVVQVKTKEPDYMVQLSEPTALRRDVLEALREVILFMQSYEQFLKVQEEKLEMFDQLKAHVKDLNSLVNNKLPLYLPKGKLDAIQKQIPKPMSDRELHPRFANKPVSTTPTFSTPKTQIKPKEHKELDDLEGQLQDIENQLKGLK
jgi:hypothetical protein